MNKNTAEIRQMFLDFFRAKGHQIVARSPLVPNNDPTLLFTNAGMNQFKNVFLGLEKRSYSRAVTSQPCIRAGGKHNDLQNIGYTTRHHTFFEMLGNFSFSDYFKVDAIQMAWELLTGKNWFNLSKDRLWITVHAADDEAYKICEKIGIQNKQIIRIGHDDADPYTSDNFWQMGDTGPCGPCVEIFYDQGNHIIGELPGSKKKCGDRYVELWNIVFMQFNRKNNGKTELLPNPSVDTGMGLERIASVLQHVDSNYKTDIFSKLIKTIARIINVTDLNQKSLCVIADHIRSCAFLISEGIVPSNENRGYVLRRIIRRSILHAHMLGTKEAFFYKLVNPLIEVMKEIGNEDLKYHQKQIEQVLKEEERRFSITLDRGLIRLDNELKKLKGNTLDGRSAFHLYDTYGFPIDLVREICYEQGIKVDENGFKFAMEEQRCRSRKFSNFSIDYSTIIHIKNISKFYGYDHLKIDSNIIALFVNGKVVDKIDVGQDAVIILDKTPFYAESGGQVGDKGKLEGDNFLFLVNNTKKYGQVIGHFGQIEFGSLKVGDSVRALVDETHRTYVCLNHSATHLMYAALRKILGDYVSQMGSLINEKMLRFDFSYSKKIERSKIYEIESFVNTQIRYNFPIQTNIIELEKVKEKIRIPLNKGYEKHVRIVRMGSCSNELCIGTHTSRTGDIGLFRIVSEFGTAAGIRRIEAVTGENAINILHMQNNQLYDIAQLLKCNNHSLVEKVQKTLDYTHQLENELKQLKRKSIMKEAEVLSKKSIEIKGIKLLVSELENIEPKMLRIIVKYLKSQFNPIVIVLSTVIKGKIFLIAGVSKEITNRIKAKELVSVIAKQVGGKGGGHLDIAQAGGINVLNLPKALSDVRGWVKMKL